MSNADELFDAIVATNLELQTLLVRTVEIVAVNHPSTASTDPKIAFSEVLTTCIPKLKESTKSYAAGKLFTSSKRDQLPTSIDISTLDTSLLLDILLKVDVFLQIKRFPGACSSMLHQTICCDNCHTQCDHSSTSCKKCKSNAGKPSSKCEHECISCGKTGLECQEYSKICCGKCKLCVVCNKKFSTTQMEVVTQKTVSTLEPPCAFYLFLHCLQVSLKWRNLFAHATFEQLQQFIDGGTLQNFEMCKDTSQLFAYIKSAFLVITDYIRNVAIFKKKALDNQKCIDFIENLDCLIRFGKPLQKYLMENYTEAKNQLENSSDIMSKFLQFEEKMFGRFQQQHQKLQQHLATIANEKKDEEEKIKSLITRLENLILSIEKRRKTPSFSLTISISRKQLEDQEQEKDRGEMFNDEDIEVGAELRIIFHNSSVQALEEVLQLKHEEHYDIIDIDCNFSEKQPTDLSVKSHIDFKMTLDDPKPFPKKLCYEMSTEAINLQEKLKVSIQKAIHAKYDMAVKVGFKRWGFGSIIIEGVISLSQSEFHDVQVTNVLEMIKTEAKAAFQNVSVELVPTKFFDYSIVNFSLNISPSNPLVVKKIKEHILAIEEAFIEKVGAALETSKGIKNTSKNVWHKALLKYCCPHVIQEYQKIKVQAKQKMLESLKSAFVFKARQILLPQLSPIQMFEMNADTALKMIEEESGNAVSELESFLKQWGSPRSREEEIANHIRCQDQAGIFKTVKINTLEGVKKCDLYCSVDFEKLQKVYINELKMFETAADLFIECTTIAPPTVWGSNIVTYVEDENGTHTQLGVNNLIPENENAWEYAERLFPQGLKMKIAEPFCKIFNDGYIGIRVDSANEILRMGDSHQRFEEIRAEAKKRVNADDLLGALTLYMDGIRQYGDVVTLLNNRSQTELKLSHYEAALLDAASALLLEPNNSKARNRYQLALKNLEYKKNNKEANHSVWKRALQNHNAQLNESEIENGSKEKGNIAYKDGRYEDAKKQYSSTLKNTANEVCILLSNIAIVCVKLHIYQTAISAASACLRISSHEDPQRKARYSMTKAFFMLGELELAKLSSNEDSTTVHFFDGSMKIPVNFIQPKTVEHSYFPCKGRGLKAIRDISKEELLLIDHPIYSTASHLNGSTVTFHWNDIAANTGDMSYQMDNLKRHILALVVYDGMLAKKLLLLETKKFQFIEEVQPKSVELPLVDVEWMAYRKLCHHISPFLPQTPQTVGVDVGQITEPLIDNIIGINTFPLLCELENGVASTIGLFLRISLINHDDQPNCAIETVNDSSILRAVKDISDGEELTISYTDDKATLLSRWGL